MTMRTATAFDGGDRVLSRTFDLVDLPAGRAVRRWEIVVPPAGDGPTEAALERAVVGLFDAIVKTVRWTVTAPAEVHS